MTTQEWLNSLKAGDEVVVCSIWGESIGVVKRVTKTQIMLPCNNAVDRVYSKKRNGRLVGGTKWSDEWIKEPTQALRNEMRINEKRVYFCRLAELASKQCKKYSEADIDKAISAMEAVVHK